MRTIHRDDGYARDVRPGRSGSLLLTGVLLGIGIAGFVDESVFHQLLQWHNFYWATSEHGRILSDGAFHVVSTLALIWGAVRLWSTPRPLNRSVRDAVLAAGLIGAGGFNAYDGIIQHVILHLHLVNERVCPTVHANNSIATCPADIPYEVAWIAVALVLVAAGVIWWRRDGGMPG